MRGRTIAVGKTPSKLQKRALLFLSRAYAHLNAARTRHVSRLKSLTSLGTKPVFPPRNRVPSLVELCHHPTENDNDHLHYTSNQIFIGLSSGDGF